MEPVEFDDEFVDDYGTVVKANSPHPAKLRESFQIVAGDMYGLKPMSECLALPPGTAATVSALVEEALAGREVARLEVTAQFKWGVRLSRQYYREIDFSTRSEGAPDEHLGAPGAVGLVLEILSRYPDLVFASVDGSVK